jgi:hypothetical protein
MAAIKDDEAAQKKGFVCIVYLAGLKDNPNALPRGRLELGLGASILLEALPYKVRGFHVCHDNILLRPLVATMQMAIGSQIRLRTRSHHGTWGWNFPRRCS